MRVPVDWEGEKVDRPVVTTVDRPTDSTNRVWVGRGGRTRTTEVVFTN